MSEEAENAVGQPGTVYQALAEHQCSETAWEGQTLVHELHRWAGIFNLEFKRDFSLNATPSGCLLKSAVVSGS